MKLLRFLSTKNTLTLVLTLSGVYVLTSTVIFSILHHFPALYWDQIDDLAAFFYAQKSHRLELWIFGHHNEHIIAVPHILFLIDWIVFGANGIFLKILMFLVQGTMVWTFWYSTKHKFTSIYSRIWFLSCTTIGMFSFTQYENFDSTFQIQFLMVYFFAQTSFFFCYYSKLFKHSTPFIYLAISLSVIASFTMANGLLVGVLLALFFTLNRDYLYAIFSILSTTCIYIVFYRTSIGENSYFIDVFKGEIFTHISDTAGFILIYLSNPLGKLFPFFIVKLIVIANLICIALTSVYTWKKADSHLTNYLLISILFIILSAGVTAAGRLQYGGEFQALSGRYTTPAIYFWILSTFIYILALDHQKHHVRVLNIIQLIMIIPVVYFCILIAAQNLNFTYYRTLHKYKELALSSIKTGSIDRNFHKYLHPNGVQRIDAFRFLKEDNRFYHGYNQVYPKDVNFNSTTAGSLPNIIVGAMNSEGILKGDRIVEIFGNPALLPKDCEDFYIWEEKVGWTGRLSRISTLNYIWPYNNYGHNGQDLIYGHSRNNSDLKRLWIFDRNGNCLAKITPDSEYLYKTSYLRNIAGYNGNDCEWETAIKAHEEMQRHLPTSIKDSAVTSIIFNTYSHSRDITNEKQFLIKLFTDTKSVSFPYISGSTSPNLAVSVSYENGEEGNEIYHIEESNNKWVYFKIPVRNVDNGRLKITITETGCNPDQWAVLGSPFYE